MSSIKELGIRVHAQTEVGDFQKKVGEVEGGLRRLQSLSVKGVRSGGIIDPKDFREADFHLKNVNKEIDRLTRLFDAATGRANKFQKQMEKLEFDIGNMELVGGDPTLIFNKKSQMNDLSRNMGQHDDLAGAYKKEIDRLRNMMNGLQGQIGGYQQGGGGSGGGTLGQMLTRGLPDWLRKYGGTALGLVGGFSLTQQAMRGVSASGQTNMMASDMGMRYGARSRGDFDQMRGWMMRSAPGLGFTPQDSMGMANTYMSMAGFVDQRRLGTMQKFTRAYGLDGGEVSGQMGRYYQQGAYKDGGMDRFAEGLSSYIDRSKMQGRAVEAMESTASILDKMASRNADQLNPFSVMAVQTAMSNTGLQGFKGARGASFISSLDDAIANPTSDAVRAYLLHRVGGMGAGASYLDATSTLEQGATGSNVQKIMSDVRGGKSEDWGVMMLRGLVPSMSVTNSRNLLRNFKEGSLPGLEAGITNGVGTEGLDAKSGAWAGSRGGELTNLEAEAEALRIEFGDMLLPAVVMVRKELQGLARLALDNPRTAAVTGATAWGLWNTQVGGGGGGGGSVGGFGGGPGSIMPMPGGLPVPGMMSSGGSGGGGGWLSNIATGLFGGWMGSRAMQGAAGAAESIAPEAIGLSRMASRSAAAVGKAGGFLRGVGRYAVPVALAADALNIGTNYAAEGGYGRNTNHAVGGALGGWGGAWAGAKLGALGGSFFGPVGTAVGAGVGGLAGWWGGSQFGGWAANAGYDAVMGPQKATPQTSYSGPSAFRAPFKGAGMNGVSWSDPAIQKYMAGDQFIQNSLTRRQPEYFSFTPEKLADVNRTSLDAGLDPRLMLSILRHEGTGSFNTLSGGKLRGLQAQGQFTDVRPAGDGEHGPNPMWNKDLEWAMDLVKDMKSQWDTNPAIRTQHNGNFLSFLNTKYATDQGWSKGVAANMTQMGGNPSNVTVMGNGGGIKYKPGMYTKSKSYDILSKAGIKPSPFSAAGAEAKMLGMFPEVDAEWATIKDRPGPIDKNYVYNQKLRKAKQVDPMGLLGINPEAVHNRDNAVSTPDDYMNGSQYVTSDGGVTTLNINVKVDGSGADSQLPGVIRKEIERWWGEQQSKPRLFMPGMPTPGANW